MTESKNIPDRLKLKAFLPYRLSVLSNQISRSISSNYEQQFSLSPAQWRIIAVLGEESDLSAAQVAKRTAMDKVTISRAVKKLLAANRLERHFSESDKRRSVLALSEQGQQIYLQIVPLALTYEAKIMQKLSNKEQKYLDYLLKKLSSIENLIE